MTERTRSARTQAARTTPVNLPALGPSAPPAVRAGISSGGQSLDTRTQREMSARFGHDFSNVRVHTDSRAGDSAASMGANAYAAGSDIVFGEGKYAPGSSDGERLIAHELTHVVQQALGGPGDPHRASARADASEREADALADQAVAGRPVQVQAAPQASLARDETEGSWLGSLASSAWGGTKAAAGAVYDGYEKATDFKALQSGIKDPKAAEESKGHWYESLVTGGMNGGIDALEKGAAAGNQKMVDDSKGHWYEGLAKGAAWMDNGATQATGGLVKGIGDLGFGLANGLAHPLDAAAGIEGVMEHNMTVPGLGSTLKAGHGAYDLLTGKKDGEYGSSWGQLADHVLNPMTQMKDDAKFDTALATGIIAPDKNKDGTTDWSAWRDKPVEAAIRAATNIAPMALGLGEAAAGDGAAEAASQGMKPVGIPELVPEPVPPTVPEPAPITVPESEPPTLPRPKPALPNWREEPPNLNPNDPRVEPRAYRGSPLPSPTTRPSRIHGVRSRCRRGPSPRPCRRRRYLSRRYPLHSRAPRHCRILPSTHTSGLTRKNGSRRPGGSPTSRRFRSIRSRSKKQRTTMKIPNLTRPWITALATVTIMPMSMPVLADATLVINGTASPADVRPLGGTAYVRLADVAKALGMTVVRHGTTYELVKAGGANQVEGVTQGKIGDTLFDGQWRFQVQSVEMPDTYTAKFLQGSNELNVDPATRVVSAPRGYRIVVVRCRMTNGQKSMQTFWFAQLSEMHVNNSLTDNNGESYPPANFDLEGDSNDQSKSLLPGAKTDFVILFSVPEALQRKDLKDLVFTLKNNGSGPSNDVRVSLTP